MKILLIVTVALLFCPFPTDTFKSKSHGAEVQTTALLSWKEPETGIEFVRIPGGCYVMGSPNEEKGRGNDEGPLHEVCLNETWIGKTEVTVGQYQSFIESSGYITQAEKEGFVWFWDGKGWPKKEGYTWANTGFRQNDSHPVVNVSWNDAKAMAKWLSIKSRGQYRLPTEAEWEYACRATSKTTYFWGDSCSEACSYANAADLALCDRQLNRKCIPCKDTYAYTAPVAQFQPNRFSLYDMSGNAWEWCEDRYSKSAYHSHNKHDPLYEGNSFIDIAMRIIGGVGTPASRRVLRGGSWLYSCSGARCAKRKGLRPDYRSFGIGFRLVCEQQ